MQAPPFTAVSVLVFSKPNEEDEDFMTMPRTQTAHFNRALFAFLTELKENNDREWFGANKERYTAEVEQPMLRFIADLGARLKTVSGSFVADARRAGGSMFRVYRDTRFSKDKTPYKTSAAAQFAHRARGKERSVPGFYLHLEPGNCVGGGGIHHPHPAALGRIRERIVAKPKEWEAVLLQGIPIEGDTLKRAPVGFDPGHRFVADLKRKDHYSMMKFSEREVCSPGFLDRYVEACGKVAPLVKFLAIALGLRW